MVISTNTWFTALAPATGLPSLPTLSQSLTTPTPVPLIPTCATSGTSFAQPPAQSLIPTICSQPHLNAQFVPAIALGNQWDLTTHSHKSSFWHGGYPLNDGSGNSLWYRVAFSSSPACSGSFNGTYQCNDRFSTILNGCQTDTISAKLGGSMSVDCGEYDLVVAATDPYAGDEDFDPGSFSCEETPVADQAMWPNSCLCWFTHLPGQTAFFEKDQNGECNVCDVDSQGGLVPGQGY